MEHAPNVTSIASTSVLPVASNVALGSDELLALIGPNSSADPATVALRLCSTDLEGRDPALFLSCFNQMRKDQTSEFSVDVNKFKSKLPLSYQKYDSLNEGQHIKLKSFVLSTLTDSLRRRIYDKMPEAGQPSTQSRAPPITKHEKARLIALRCFTGAQRIIVNAYSPQSRQVLDGAESNEHVTLRYFNELASIYNDRSRVPSNQFRYEVI